MPEIWNLYDRDRRDTGRLAVRGDRLQPEETCAARYASADEISRMVHSGEWIPMEKFSYLHRLGID